MMDYGILYLTGMFVVMISTVILNEFFLYKKYQIDIPIIIVMSTLSWFSMVLLVIGLEKQMIKGH